MLHSPRNLKHREPVSQTRNLRSLNPTCCSKPTTSHKTVQNNFNAQSCEYRFVPQTPGPAQSHRLKELCLHLAARVRAPVRFGLKIRVPRFRCSDFRSKLCLPSLDIPDFRAYGVLTVNSIKLETGLRPNSAGIPYTLLLRTEAIGFPTLGLLLYSVGFFG